MKHVTTKITLDELRSMAENSFGDMVKAVIDVENKTMIVDAELHADQENSMIEKGSEQKNLWGINIHPFDPVDKMIEFDSMINLRPWMNNRTRGVDSKEIQERIKKIFLEMLTL